MNLIRNYKPKNTPSNTPVKIITGELSNSKRVAIWKARKLSFFKDSSATFPLVLFK